MKFCHLLIKVCALNNTPEASIKNDECMMHDAVQEKTRLLLERTAGLHQ